jgi:hypothetical protein
MGSRESLSRVLLPADASAALDAATKQAVDAATSAVNVKTAYGAKGDGRTVTDGAMTSGSATLTSATAAFTAADVGKKILVSCATSTTMRLAGRIATVGSGTSVTLTVAAAITGTGKTMVIDGIRTVTDAVTTANSTTVTSATAAFTAADVGKAVWIDTVNTVALNTAISGYTNATTVTLAASATRTATNALVTYGTDDTTAIIAAFAAAAAVPGSVLYFPAGVYLATPSHIGTNAMNIPANTRIFGDGWDSIIRSIGNENPANRSFELWGINTGSGGTADPATNTTNVIIEDMQFQGTQMEEGFLENGCNLLSLNACSDVIVRGCRFYNTRSDCIYFGSGTTGNVERHNERVRIENCVFDGVANQCRNGISVVDGTDISIDRCAFMNLARDDMPGAIDSEPNDFNYIRFRGVRITNCSFTMIGGNQGICSIYLNTPVDNFTVPPQGWLLAHNYFYNNLSSTVGFLCFAPSYPSETSPRQNIEVIDNFWRGFPADGTGLAYIFDLEGVRGARIAGNNWDVSQYSGIVGNNYKCLDIDIQNNTFKDIGYAGGKAIEICRVDRLNIDGNTFDHTSPAGSGGYIMRLVNGATLATPSNLVLTPSTTGGTLAAGTKAYRVAAILDDGSSTVACAEVTTSTSGSTGSVALTWTAIYGAKGYTVYGRASGAELLMTTLTGVMSTTFTDTGSITPSGALPTATSTNGHTNGLVFANNIIRQGSANNTNNVCGLVAGHVNTANNNVYFNNYLPQNAALPITPFINQTIAYTITTAALTVDASLVPPNGTVVLTGSTTSAAGALTISNPTNGQIITFQYVIPTTNYTYATASTMKFAGAAAATHTLTAGRSDIYTFRFNGTNWLELARAINVG